jgi:hypothetical protein
MSGGRRSRRRALVRLMGAKFVQGEGGRRGSGRHVYGYGNDIERHEGDRIWRIIARRNGKGDENRVKGGLRDKVDGELGPGRRLIE